MNDPVVYRFGGGLAARPITYASDELWGDGFFDSMRALGAHRLFCRPLEMARNDDWDLDEIDAFFLTSQQLESLHERWKLLDHRRHHPVSPTNFSVAAVNNVHWDQLGACIAARKRQLDEAGVREVWQVPIGSIAPNIGRMPPVGSRQRQLLELMSPPMEEFFVREAIPGPKQYARNLERRRMNDVADYVVFPSGAMWCGPMCVLDDMLDFMWSRYDHEASDDAFRQSIRAYERSGVWLLCDLPCEAIARVEFWTGLYVTEAMSTVSHWEESVHPQVDWMCRVFQAFFSIDRRIDPATGRWLDEQ